MEEFMTTFSVLKFDTSDGAGLALDTLHNLAHRQEETQTQKLTEGTSALPPMTSNATEDKVIEAMKEHKFQILTTNLSKEQEDALCRAFSEEE